jgi:hypothetical protein
VTERGVSVLSLPVVAVLLGALVFALLYLGRLWGLGNQAVYLLAVPVVLAIVYLAWYRTLPYEPARPAVARATTAPSLDPDEPFEDPVEEADRLESDEEEPARVEGPGVGDSDESD